MEFLLAVHALILLCTVFCIFADPNIKMALP